MHQDLDGDSPQWIEGAQNIQSRRSIKAKYSLPTIQYYKGLKQRKKDCSYSSHNLRQPLFKSVSQGVM